MASHTNKCVQEEEDLATMTEIINREIVDRPKASNGTKSRAVGVVAWQVLATHSFYVLSEGGAIKHREPFLFEGVWSRIQSVSLMHYYRIRMLPAVMGSSAVRFNASE